MATTVRPVASPDELRWRDLWSAYNRFYEHDVSDAIARSTWSRILDPASPMHAIVAEHADGTLIGLANYILHASTWSIAPVCCLEDLYVDVDRRNGSVGRLLIDWLIAEMRRQGWSELYWITREDNYRARALYDKYTPHSGFLRYILPNGA